MGKAADFFKRLKGVRHIELYIGAAVLAVVLVVYFSCVSCGTKETSGSIELSGADYCTSTQVRLERIVSQISGVGDASVMINWDRSVNTSAFAGASTENPKATGVIVVCDGGDSTKVKMDIAYAVSTLLDLSIEKIIVYPKSK